ncbi:MAG: acyl-CoA dehydrogenase family protein [Phormidesmis sp.]
MQSALAAAIAPADFNPLRRYLTEQVVSIAHRLDSESAMLFEAFEELGKRELLVPKSPVALGGLGLNTLDFLQFQSLIAQHSGALAFLQTQHQSAANFLLASQNRALAEAYLPAMAVGEKRVGVGFSQLRREPAPLVAQPVAGGYRLRGEVPWVSGAGLFDEFVGAAMLPTGEAVFGLLPLVSCGDSEAQIAVSEPMALFAMAATNTVCVQLQNWFLPAAQVVGIRPKGWIAKRDRTHPLSPLGLMFGCTQAGIDSLQTSLKRRQIDKAIANTLTAQLSQLQAELPEMMALPEDTYRQKLALRGRAISLMNTCAQAAIIAASGAANVLGHPAQRVYKESLVFSVSGQTTAGAIASLSQLLPGPSA